MAETVYVTTPIEITFEIDKDPSGLYVGHLAEFPGIISQGRTRRSVKRKLVGLLRQISRDHPEELGLFR